MPEPGGRPATFLSGQRLGFAGLPSPVRDAVERFTGPVTGVRDCAGGMSQGCASVVTGSRGEAFVKAVSRQLNPYAAGMLEREARNAERLPRDPSIPRILGLEMLVVQGGADVHGPSEATVEPRGADAEWLVQVQEAVAGVTAAHPWTLDQATRVLDAWYGLAPALHAIPVVDLPVSDVDAFLGRCDLVLADPEESWRAFAAQWRDRCAELSAATVSGHLVASHVDLRADNVLVGDGVWFVDWAQLSLAAPWVDPLLLVIDMAGSGADICAGGRIDLVDLWATHPLTRGLPPQMLVTGAAAMAFGLHRVARTPRPGLPQRESWGRAMADGLRAFVTAHATA